MTIGSLFSGIGGLELGLEMCGLGPVIWQAECDPAALAVLAHHWPNARRYTDVRDIDATAPAVDVICGGFPCQDVSSAGKRIGLSGERSGLWWQFRRIVRTCRPAFVFIENVNSGRRAWLPVVRRSLWRVGYATLPIRVSAADVGAPHERARVFVLAYADRQQVRLQPGRRQWQVGPGEAVPANDGQPRSLADPNREGQLQPVRRIGEEWRRFGHGGESMADADGERPQEPGDNAVSAQQEDAQRSDHATDGGVWAVEPDVGRVAHGVPARVDRLRLLGNAVVPQQAAVAWRELYSRVCRIQEAA